MVMNCLRNPLAFFLFLNSYLYKLHTIFIELMELFYSSQIFQKVIIAFFFFKVRDQNVFQLFGFLAEMRLLSVKYKETGSGNV